MDGSWWLLRVTALLAVATLPVRAKSKPVALVALAALLACVDSVLAVVVCSVATARCFYLLHYLWVVSFHKACVLYAGLYVNASLRRARVPLHVPLHRLIFHDWVKFLPAEYLPYAAQFCLPPAADPADAEVRRKAFAVAVAHHTSRMDHHWEYHAGHRMATPAAVEVAVDMVAAEMSYSWRFPKPPWPHFDALVDKGPTRFHPESLDTIFRVFGVLGFEKPV